jgi:PAS domain S-box-containing protein
MIGQIFDIANYTISLFSLPTAVVSTGIFFLGFWILIRERANLLSVAFFLMTLAFSEWFFAFTFMYSCTNESIALFWAKFGYIGVPCIPSSIYMFVVLGLGIYQQWKTLVWINWVLSGVFSIAIINSDALIATLYHYWWGFYPKYGWLSVPFLTFFFAVNILCAYHGWKEYHRAVPGTIYQKRIKVMTAALVICSIGVVDFIAKYGFPVYPFGYVPFTAFLFVTLYFLRHYRVVEITTALAANAIVDTMSDAMYAVDRTGVIVMVNNAARILFGRPDSDIIGRPAMEIVGGELFTGKFDSVLKKGNFRNYEMEHITQMGDFRTLSLSATTMHEREEKEPVGMLFVARDITEIKQQEAELERVNKELRDRQEITERELELAANIQTQLFPDKPPVNKDWDIAFYFRPMIGVSGDFYDFYEEKGSLKGVVLCDVSGHGISSGLITMLAKSIISRHFSGGPDNRLRRIIENVDKDLIKEFRSIDNYLTAIMLKFTGDEVEYANASSPDILLKRAKSGVVLFVKPTDRELKGRLLGTDVFTDPYEVMSFSVVKGDVLLLFSDGLVDCMHTNNERFGLERIVGSFKNAPDGSAQEILDSITDVFHEHIKNRSISDDVTMMVLKRLR